MEQTDDYVFGLCNVAISKAHNEIGRDRMKEKTRKLSFVSRRQMFINAKPNDGRKMRGGKERRIIQSIRMEQTMKHIYLMTQCYIS